VYRRVGHRVTASSVPVALFSLGGIRLDCARRTVHNAAGERINLTAAAYAALERLFLAKGQVVTRDEISMAALHRPWRAEDRSVDQLILHLRQKLAADEDGQSLIQSIRGTGYLLRLAEPAAA
jgi:DNA-binding response OmpR family regulator